MTLKQREAETVNALYEAADAYVNLYGGNIVVAGGIEIMTYPTYNPEDNKYSFRLCIKCTGKIPTSKENPHDT